MYKLCTRSTRIKFKKLFNDGKLKKTICVPLLVVITIYLLMNNYFVISLHQTTTSTDMSQNADSTNRSQPKYYVALRGAKHILLPGGSYQILSAEAKRNQSKLVTVHHFLSRDHMYLIDNKDRCSSYRELRLVIVIFSSPDNIHYRDAVRQRLLSQITPDKLVTFVFLLGRVQESGSNYRPAITIKEENYINGDIVQGNFVDSYRNLTLKSATMIHWTKTYCKNAQFLLKVDINVDIDLLKLFKVLDALRIPAQQYAVCNIVLYSRPERDRNSKYYVSKSSYIHMRYPMYCKGGAYILTTNAVEEMWQATYFLEFLALEDVYLTGFIRGMIGMSLRKTRGRKPLFCDLMEIEQNITCSLTHT